MPMCLHHRQCLEMIVILYINGGECPNCQSLHIMYTFLYLYIYIYISDYIPDSLLGDHDDRFGMTWVHRISLTPLHQQILSGLVGHTGHQRWITNIAHVIRTTSIVQKPCSSAWLCIAGVRVASTFLQANSMSFPPHHHQQQHHRRIII